MGTNKREVRKMTSHEIITEAREYAANDAVYKNIENGTTYAKEEIAERSYISGLKSGLKHHAHDYLVTTKQRIEKVKENYKTRIQELEKDKQYFSDSLDKQIEATLELQQNYEKQKEINKELVEENERLKAQIRAEAEQAARDIRARFPC